jgi:hypothetical protein
MARMQQRAGPVRPLISSEDDASAVGGEDVPLAPATAERFVIEREIRLSRSLLWAAQRRFFDRQGVAAWSTGPVPSYVTNNPALARAYAELALGFLRDRAAAGARFDADNPFTVIELGAGSGRFAFFFVTRLRALLALSPFADVPFRYVMTDFTRSNLDFWRRHEALAPLREARLLDFALFDAEGDAHLNLDIAQRTVTPGTLAHPPVVIANYVFDGVTQDAFSVRGGEVLDCRVTLSAATPDPDLDDPQVMAALTAGYSDHPLAGPAYPEPLFNEILADYAQSLGDTTILFPATALRCLDRLARWCDGRMLLLTADRGEQREEDLGRRQSLGLAVHGSISFPVNYHAIAEYVVRRGGEVLTTAYRHANLAVSAFLVGGGDYGETRLAFDQAVQHFGPDDFFTLCQGLRAAPGQLALAQLLALLRLSCCDLRLLRDCAATLLAQLETARDTERQELCRIVEEAAADYYHLGEPRDALFDCAMLLQAAKDHAGALRLYRRSRQYYGESAATFWNMALCHAALGDGAEADFCLTEAKRLDAAFAAVTAVPALSTEP